MRCRAVGVVVGPAVRFQQGGGGEVEVAGVLVLALPFALWGVWRPFHRVVSVGGEWSRVDGVDVPYTGGVLFVHAIPDTAGRACWVISHAPSGCRVSARYGFHEARGAIEAAGLFWMELDDVSRARLSANDLESLGSDRYARDIYQETVASEADLLITWTENESEGGDVKAS